MSTRFLQIGTLFMPLKDVKIQVCDDNTNTFFHFSNPEIAAIISLCFLELARGHSFLLHCALPRNRQETQRAAGVQTVDHFAGQSEEELSILDRWLVQFL